jgi:chromosome segregation ATPase
MASVNDSTEITIPLRNLIAIVSAIAIASWTYAGINERLNMIEHTNAQNKVLRDLNTEFRIKWPRGEMGALPADSKQDMLIEGIERRFNNLKDGFDKKVEEMHHIENDLDSTKVRVGALEDFANRPSRSAAEIKILEHQINELKIRIEKLESN